MAGQWLANNSRVAESSLPSFGTKPILPNDRFDLEWSTLMGITIPDELRRMRYFSNRILKYQISEKMEG